MDHNLITNAETHLKKLDNYLSITHLIANTETHFR